MSFLQPVGNAPRKSTPQNSKPSSSLRFPTPETGKTVIRPSSSKKFPATVCSLHGDAINVKILRNFNGRVASMMKQQFVDSTVSYAAKVCPAFSESQFTKHTIIATVKTEPAITQKLTLEFQVDKVIFVPEHKIEWESHKSYTVRCNGNLAQFFHKNLAVSDVAMIAGGTLICPGTNNWNQTILDLTDEKVKGPISIVRLINTLKQKNNGTDEVPSRTAFGNSEMNNQLKIYGKQWTDLNINENDTIGIRK